MCRHDHHQPDIAVGHNGGVIVENGHEIFAEAQDQRNGRAQHHRALDQAQRERLFAAAQLARAKVLSHKRRARLREGVQNVVGDDLDVKGRARGRHDHRAERVDGRLDDDVRCGKHRALHARRQADAQDAAKDRKVDFERARLQMNFLRRAAQSSVKQRRADGVGDDRRDGHAVDRHMQNDDEENVQRHVQNARGRQRDQRDLRLADAPENGRLKVIKQDHRHAGQIDAQIQKRQREHIIRHVERPQKRRRDQFPKQRHKKSSDDGDQDGGMDGLFDCVVLSLPDGVGDDHVRAQRNADKKIDDQADDRAVCTDSRDRRRSARTRKVADDRHVRRVKKLLQDRCRRHRQRKLRDLVPDGTMEHIDMLLFLHE